MFDHLFGAFVVFAFVASITPGPNNIMLMKSGLNFGFARTRPILFGVPVGFALMVAIVGLGLGAFFTAYPAAYTVVKYAAAVYLVYLAWMIANAGPMKDGDASGRPFSFLEAVAFQWVNPKGWAMAVGAASTYAAFAAFPFNMLAMAFVFGACGVVSSLIWVWFGTTLRRVVTDAKTMRFFNVFMAILLVASLIPVLGDL